MTLAASATITSRHSRCRRRAARHSRPFQRAQGSGPPTIVRNARSGGLRRALVAVGDRASSQAVGVTLSVPRGFQNAFGQRLPASNFAGER